MSDAGQRSCLPSCSKVSGEAKQDGARPGTHLQLRRVHDGHPRLRNAEHAASRR
jgi:hypothetical protein